MEKKKEWKSTLLMPKTNFEMKAGLVRKEPEYRQKWLDDGIYKKVLEQNKDNTPFILHDGPPYANGSLHVGHALNKILKDVILRRKSMEGFYTPFTAGWDTHGLPIENKMLETLKMTKDDLDKLTLRVEAEKYARKQIEIQKNQFKQMQLFTDMSETYVTLDKEFEVGELKLFKKMALDGLIYKGLKPVYWSPSSMSALAEAEVEYEDIRSPQIILTFNITKGKGKIVAGDKLSIMTTTPWTIPANSGVAVGSKFEYALVAVNDSRIIVATDLLASVAELAKWEDYKIVETFNGSELEGMEYESPINKLIAPVIIGHHVTTQAGTGLVHMAPLFGEDDFIIGKQNKLEMIMHVADDGTLTSDAGKYEGLFYELANRDIGMDLDKSGHLLSLKFVKHSYPHDWRTHKPVIFRGTPQWFVSIDKIKPQIISELKKVKSTPDWGVDRMIKMIEGRSDWTISRQRTWGVPIIIFYDVNEEPIIDEKVFDFVIDLVSKEGTNIWWEKTTDELLPPEYRGKGWTREMDIMDVWFDSGSSHMSVKPGGIEAPFDLYFEGSDQYRGWFNSSLINSVAYRGKSPYKQLLSHGFVLDGKRKKMSKSKGNVIDPLTIIQKNGADVLRLWAANSEYTSDVTISDEIIKQNIEVYRRIRNTTRFMLGNLFDYDASKKVELDGVHLLVHEQLGNLITSTKENYTAFKFQSVIKDINQFMIDLSSFYFDFNKDSLYCDAADDLNRRQVQTNIWAITNFVIKALAPIIPTTMEEAYNEFNKANKKESVFLETFKPQSGCSLEKQQTKWEAFFKLRDLANVEIEKATKEGTIKRRNEVILTIDVSIVKELNLTLQQIQQMLMVAKVIDGKDINVESFDSVKCPRCWNHFDAKELLQTGLCARCDKVVAKL